MYALRNISRLSQSAAAVRTAPKAFNAAFLKKGKLPPPSIDSHPSYLSLFPLSRSICILAQLSITSPTIVIPISPPLLHIEYSCSRSNLLVPFSLDLFHCANALHILP